MKKHILLFAIVVSIALSCKKESHQIVKTDDFELIIPNNPKAILILFPGYLGNVENIKKESKIPTTANNNGIVTLVFNTYNRFLFLPENKKNDLQKLIVNTLNKYNLNHLNVFLGGFSSGGNVALMISNHLNIKGLFVIDSPVDLAQFYLNNQKQINRLSDSELNEESYAWINYFNKTLGDHQQNISHYENASPYTVSTDFSYNIDHLKNTSVRLYTEPDLEWWQKTNGDTYEELNAYSIKKMHDALVALGAQDVKYIETSNLGYRSNGQRSPHSWSIADANKITKWILEKTLN